MFKCVLTGGPCAGKTTILKRLTDELTRRGYYVFCCPEAATDLITNGIEITNELCLEDFQNFVLAKQLANEKLYDDLQNYYPSEKIIVFYDRGLMDQRAYMDNDDKFNELLASKFINKYDAMTHYDAVFHLVTAADGAAKYYQWNDPNSDTECNNKARRESPEQAIESDRKILNCWTGHPKLRIFDNSTDFEGKIKRVLEELFLMLSEPVPKSVQKKYLIEIPSKNVIKSFNMLSYPTTIVQTYLIDRKKNTERRIRQRGNKDNGYSFYYNEKMTLGPGVRADIERKINKEQYVEMMTEADTTLHQIIKTRYSLVNGTKQFEIDIYPFNKQYAIMEVPIHDCQEDVNLPEKIKVIKEVTDIEGYKNKSLAKTMKFPDL